MRELTVIYTVTLDDIVNIMLKGLQDEGEIPTDATSEELEAFRTQLGK
jgi:antitoxin component of RelBE/YafQ-DinJ toxin-antitoxin module